VLKVFAYAELPKCDLIVDAIYEGDSGGQLGGEPLSALLVGVGNQGGFRAAGRGDDKKFVVLYTSGEDADWPDSLDLNTGQFIYYGDNKSPGHELHDTVPGGNRILRHIFHLLHGSAEDRRRIPPFFTFRKYPTAVSGRSIQFQGVAVPGFRGLPATSDLVAVWKTSRNRRFQNYRATFTVLDIPLVPRAWLQVSRSALFDGGLSRVFEGVPGSGSGVL
jgi:Restriction endonuclease AspBHI N-terminal